MKKMATSSATILVKIVMMICEREGSGDESLSIFVCSVLGTVYRAAFALVAHFQMQ